MPSLRKPLSVKQKLNALYTDPIPYALADHIARHVFAAEPGSADYRRHVTCFMLDIEARVHTNRQQGERHAADPENWNQRRLWALQVTGADVLLAQAPTALVVRKWRYRWIAPDNWSGIERAKLADEERKRLEAADRNTAQFVDQYERQAIARARALGQFPVKKRRNLAKLPVSSVCSADGSYVRAFSKADDYLDPETGEVRFLGAGNRDARIEDGKVRGTRLQKSVHRAKKADRETMGLNHVAVLTRTPFGRVILSIEQALGGEVHAALRAMDRIAPLAEGAIKALTYDKALSGWQIDYLLARHGIVSVAPPIAANGRLADVNNANYVAEQIMAAKRSATQHGSGISASDPGPGKVDKEYRTGRSTGIKTALVTRALGKAFNVDRLVADAEAGRALGAGLPVGTSVYLDHQNRVVPVKSQHQPYKTIGHQVGPEWCAHDLVVDDGALWDNRLERGQQVKDQRLACVHAEPVKNPHTGWYHLNSTYGFVCEYTGEVLTHVVKHAPSGRWWPDEDAKEEEKKRKKKRSAIHNMMILAPCDRRWRKIYGLRNDCESWFAWLKEQLLDDKRAPSLDLNHQLLDVLYAGMITNAITLFNYRRESHL